jgi:subtilisin family serine protease
MGRRIAALITLLSVALLAALPPMASFAGKSNGGPPIFYQAPTPLGAPPGFSGSNGQLTVMIELSEPAAIAAPTPADVVARSRRITTEQTTLVTGLAALKAQILFQTSLVYNGIAVTISPDQIDLLRALPGVVGVHVIQLKQRSNAQVVPFVGAPMVWSGPDGATGRGIRIGIVDSGIDYTHADFGGPGTLAAYNTNDRTIIEPGSFPTAKVVGGYDFAGDAYDAASADPAKRVPHADPDPLDCMGHGTHVAGTAAGLGVSADGTTYHGPYTSGLDFSAFRVGPGVAPEAQLYALKVFGCHGMTALTTLAIERALDPNGDGDPADHLDVLNISLGSPFGSDDDPDSVAVNNAVRAGIIVVTAAGDHGNTFYATDAPASAQLAIAVGASVDAARATPAAPADSLAALSSRGPQRGNGALKPDLVAPGLNLISAAFGTGNAAIPMSGTSTAAPQVAGAAALLRQLHALWTPEQIKAALMNTAVPVMLANGTPYPPSLVGAGRLDMSHLAGLDMLAYAGDGSDAVALNYGAPWIAHPWTVTQPLRLKNNSDAFRVVTLSATTTVSESGVTITPPTAPISMSPYSSVEVPISISVDPQALDFTPDAATALTQDGVPRYFMAEHGGYIEVHSGGGGNSVRVRPAHAAHFGDVDFYLDDQLLADSLDSHELVAYSDTTPGMHTVRVLRPGTSPHAHPILTAPVQLLDGHDYTLIIVGRPGALGLVVVDETAPAPPSVGQALLHFVNANRVEHQWNIGPLDVYLDGVLRAAALPVGQASSYIALTPGTHTVFFFRAGADPALHDWVTRKTFVVNVGELILLGTGRHDDGDLKDFEQRAFIRRAMPRSSMALRVPFDIFPKSASEARAANAAVTIPPGANVFEVGLRNTGARNAGLSAGGLASPQTPLASAFELEATSPILPALSGGLRAADLRYVGVTNNFSVTQNISGTVIFFGLSTYAPWSTPNEVQFRVYFDTNFDGIDDHVLVNRSQSGPTDTNDAFVSVLYKILPDGSLQPTFWMSPWGTFRPPTIQPGFDMAPFNTSVMLQAVLVRFLELQPGQASFRYRLETRARDRSFFTSAVDRVPELDPAGHVQWLQYDINQTAIAPINVVTPIIPLRPIFLDVDGGQMTGAVNTAVLSTRPSTRMLVLHLHNQPSAQAEIVDVRSSAAFVETRLSTSRVFLPVVVRTP